MSDGFNEVGGVKSQGRACEKRREREGERGTGKGLKARDGKRGRGEVGQERKEENRLNQLRMWGQRHRTNRRKRNKAFLPQMKEQGVVERGGKEEGTTRWTQTHSKASNTACACCC